MILEISRQRSDNVSDWKYGPPTAEIEALFEQVKTITPEKARALSDAVVVRSEEPWRALEVARITLRGARREAMWSKALDVVREALVDEVWGTVPEVAVVAVHDALAALLVRDQITTEQFDTLYAPWAWIVDERPYV